MTTSKKGTARATAEKKKLEAPRYQNIRLRVPEDDQITLDFLRAQGPRNRSVALRQMIQMFVAEHGVVDVTTIMGQRLIDASRLSREHIDSPKSHAAPTPPALIEVMEKLDQAEEPGADNREAVLPTPVDPDDLVVSADTSVDDMAGDAIEVVEPAPEPAPEKPSAQAKQKSPSTVAGDVAHLLDGDQAPRTNNFEMPDFD